MRSKIITVLRKHEQHLSDGFGYYAPSWLAEYGDIEGPDGFLEIVATEILAALAKELDEAKAWLGLT